VSFLERPFGEEGIVVRMLGTGRMVVVGDGRVRGRRTRLREQRGRSKRRGRGRGRGSRTLDSSFESAKDRDAIKVDARIGVHGCVVIVERFDPSFSISGRVGS